MLCSESGYFSSVITEPNEISSPKNATIRYPGVLPSSSEEARMRILGYE
jgi:hypothetical protein